MKIIVCALFLSRHISTYRYYGTVPVQRSIFYVLCETTKVIRHFSLASEIFTILDRMSEPGRNQYMYKGNGRMLNTETVHSIRVAIISWHSD